MHSGLVSFDLLEKYIPAEQIQSSGHSRALEAARGVLGQALEQELTGRQLECVRLYYFEGRKQEEIAGLLGVGKSTVCRHLQKARGRLERALSYAIAGTKN